MRFEVIKLLFLLATMFFDLLKTIIYKYTRQNLLESIIMKFNKINLTFNLWI